MAIPTRYSLVDIAIFLDLSTNNINNKINKLVGSDRNSDAQPWGYS